MSIGNLASDRHRMPEAIWLTHGPVPAASAVAWSLGWLAEEFGQDGIRVGRIYENGLNIVACDPERQARHLFREGGNIKALAARALGAPTRVIGLTWIDEGQAIVVRPDTPVLDPADLGGLRFALPGFAAHPGESMARGMSLHGIRSALALGGHVLAAADLVEIPVPGVGRLTPERMRQLWNALDWVADGRADAAYIKGAAAAEMAESLGLVVAIDLDAYPSRLARINNGTPRPIVVHEHMLERHPELVERFLEQTMRAADWAATHPRELSPILARTTLAGPDGVAMAYRRGVHRALHPDLSPDRIGMLRVQADFLWDNGFLARRVEVNQWIEPGPLHAVLARKQREQARIPAGLKLG
ncbi:ABC transporter substrate-binding protein [Novosphingobium flavum]|uniref:ABC transporter substrate-binding protein n=1 Tax=Novosphingobium flavum TaxID=1778672 RepID=A0A7X1FNW4_9SPHN|nr:ABC transporter substrate-binding protein [Novosphingobium flavum]MBC2664178.1 ABC transporter substrate-binding protein [Novosphingobium flavum]